MKNIINKIKSLFSKKPNKSSIIYMEDEPDMLSELENQKYINVTFRMSPLEAWRIDKFKKEHKKICGSTHYYTMFSSSSGIGYNVLCICENCRQICDVTDVSGW